MAFLDKVLGKDERERKLEKEIRSLELRKESVFSAINGEIARLQRERSNVLLTAGTAAYEAWNKDKAQADLTEFWDKIQDLEKQIAEQETKRTEMGIKYDEEIRLINSNLGMHAANATSTVGTGAACPKCGAAISDDDIFCQGCGAKLK
ncbi:MAG: zinc ribbon domain-containing protein [Lachnospiraceae bacterium]|nr:zinc ribbon domain-containing protein [Lachnospiraceae bacterium]